MLVNRKSTNSLFFFHIDTYHQFHGLMQVEGGMYRQAMLSLAYDRYKYLMQNIVDISKNAIYSVHKLKIKAT